MRRPLFAYFLVCLSLILFEKSNRLKYLWFAWIFLNSPEFSWIRYNSVKFRQVRLNSFEFCWIYLSYIESVWICWHSLKFMWILLNLPEFTLNSHSKKFQWIQQNSNHCSMRNWKLKHDFEKYKTWTEILIEFFLTKFFLYARALRYSYATSRRHAVWCLGASGHQGRF